MSDEKSLGSWYTYRSGTTMAPLSDGPLNAIAPTLGRTGCRERGITVVVDPHDGTAIRDMPGLACRRGGRVVLHTSPGQRRAWRLRTELLTALGKHHEQRLQQGMASTAALVNTWLRIERIRELIVLRAHQITGSALTWLLDVPQDGPRLWLITPRPLPAIAEHAQVPVAHLDAAEFAQQLPAHPRDCGCEDLNCRAVADCPIAPTVLTPDVTRRLRRLCDPDNAVVAAITMLLDRPTPDELAAWRVHIAADAASITTAQDQRVAVPERAQTLLHVRAGAPLVPHEWSHEVTATYLTLRMEDAQRYLGFGLLDPDHPMLPTVAWHQHHEPGADVLAAMTRSSHLVRSRGRPACTDTRAFVY